MNTQEQNFQHNMNIVIVGHVDHGKSTLVGRLLADTDSLPKGKLEQVKKECERNSKPFEYAFLIDALKDERAQGITIDAARVFFKSKKRHYIIIDAPGHIEFLKNMITGAARAEAAVLVIDAHEGIQENSKRHGYLLSMLGIRQIAIAVNKIDLVGYDEKKFQQLCEQYRVFLKNLNITDVTFIPVSGFNGDNVASRSQNMPWYQGPHILEKLDSFAKEKNLQDADLKIPVQDVYKFTNYGDDRRIIVGTVESGKISKGDEVVFYPSGKSSRVKKIETFHADEPKNVSAGYSVAFTLEEQIYVSRGELATLKKQAKPSISTKIRVSIFWLGKKALSTKKNYFLKIGKTKVPAQLEKIIRVIDAAELNTEEQKSVIDRHDVAEVIFTLKKPVAHDLADSNSPLSRFVVVDDYEIAGGGIIRESLPDDDLQLRPNILQKNFGWSTGKISMPDRNQKFRQKSGLILISGNSLKNSEESDGAQQTELGIQLEQSLFQHGYFTYFVSLSHFNFDSDSANNFGHPDRQKHIKKMAELAHTLIDAGAIVIVAVEKLVQGELEVVKEIVQHNRLEMILASPAPTTELSYDFYIDSEADSAIQLNLLLENLRTKGFIFTL